MECPCRKLRWVIIHILSKFFLGTIPTREQMRLGSSGHLNGPNTLPKATSLPKCCCSSLGCWKADFKLVWILPWWGPLYFKEKPWWNPCMTSLTSCWLGWPCSSCSNLLTLTGVRRGSCSSCCHRCSDSALGCRVSVPPTFIAVVWKSAGWSRTVAFVTVETGTKILGGSILTKIFLMNSM